jgi:hypothetical protein
MLIELILMMTYYTGIISIISDIVIILVDVFDHKLYC